MLYAHAEDRWQSIDQIEHNEWISLKLIFEKDSYDIQVGDKTVTGLKYSIARMNPRLYLGDGYEIDYIPSNRNSIFYVDVNSMRTAVLR